MIKAIFFDLDDTLFDSTGISRKARWESCNAMIGEGLPAKSIKEAFNRLNSLIKKHGSNYIGHFDRLCEAYSLEPDPKIVAAGIIAYHNYKSAALQPFSHTRETLIELLKNRKRLALITNGVAMKQWDKILRLKIREFFEVVHVSDSKKQNLSKSDMIKKAMNKMKLKNSEIIFVGDRLDSDIVSANELGIWSIQILKGKYAKKKPQGRFEKPDYKIKNITELFEVVSEISLRKDKKRSIQKTLV